jgi:putative Mn2+ efflux pump MntP
MELTAFQAVLLTGAFSVVATLLGTYVGYRLSRAVSERSNRRLVLREIAFE